MIRKILIPLDLTSSEASRLAIRLARPFRAELIFVHCLRPPALTSTFFFPKDRNQGSDQPSPEERHRAEEEISAFLTDLHPGDLRCTWQIRKGSVLREILKAADSVRPDWIIQGSKVFSRLEEWIPRGTSWRLIQRASCAVITVKHDPPAPRLPVPPGPSHWLSPASAPTPEATAPAPASPRKILFLTDFGESSRSGLSHAAALANRTGAALVILHVLADGRLPGIPPNRSVADPAAQIEFLLEEARALQTGVEASACLGIGNPEEAILSQAGKGDVDLIVMGTGGGGSGLIQGTTLVERIFCRAPCPVMTVNREGASSGIERRYRKIFRRLTPEDLAQISEEQPEAIGEDLFRSAPPFRTTELFLKHYSHAGLTRILEEYGIFPLLRRKGFSDPKIMLHLDDPYRQRLRVCFGGQEDERHTLMEMILREGFLEAPHPKEAPVRGHYFPVLMVEWLSMQDPAAGFTPERPPLPGQQHPGLGISREMLQLISLIGMRIGKDGVAIHPQYFHAALLYHRLFKCYNPVQEGQLAALMRDTEEFNLDDVSWAIELDCLRGELRQKASWEVDYQVHALTEPLRRHFDSEPYRKLFRESLAGHRYSIDWPQFNKRLRLRAAAVDPAS